MKGSTMLQGPSSKIISLKSIKLNNKKVLLRADLNVPIEGGIVTNNARIKAAIPTLNYLLDKNAAVILVSHLGRPQSKEDHSKFTLKPVANVLEQLLQKHVRFVRDWVDGVEIKPGEIILCENVRFLEGETSNSLVLAEKMAKICDVFVMDAFGSAHRAHASTVGITNFVKEKSSGFLLEKEYSSLTNFLTNPKKPVLGIVGGAKVSSKLTVLENIITKVDYLILGGGIANTFLLAQGFNIGESLVEKDLVSKAQTILALAETNKAQILLPKDVIVADDLSETAQSEEKLLEKIGPNDKIFDIGSLTQKMYSQYISKAKTILWNGPVGVFEINQFSDGTKSLANSITENSNAFSIAGGGDTIAAVEKFNLSSRISYISTGGGAFLEFIEGKTLPGIKPLLT